jgi:hypothetical protein
METFVEQVLDWLDSRKDQTVSYLDAAILDLRPCDGFDGWPCMQIAVVHDLDSEQDFCLRCNSEWLKSGHKAIGEGYQFGTLPSAADLDAVEAERIIAQKTEG